MKWILVWLCLTTQAVAQIPILSVEVLENGETKQRGSAVAVAVDPVNPADGFIAITAAHVVVKDIQVKDGKFSYVFFPSNYSFEVFAGVDWEPALVRNASTQGDVAILTVYTKTAVPTVGLSDKTLEVLDPIVGAGYVLGLDFDVVPGIFIGENYPNCGILYSPDYRVIPGQSGGPVFSKDGKLVGILSSYSGNEPWVINYTPVSDVKRLLETKWDRKIHEVKKVSKPGAIRAKPRIAPRIASRISLEAPSKP